jgi:hypothetical protein
MTRGIAQEIFIYDPIDRFEGVTAKGIAEQLKAAGRNEIHVRINSPGGSVFEGLAIFNLLPFQWRHRENEGTGITYSLIAEKNRIIQIALLFRLVDGHKIVLVGIKKLQGFIFMQWQIQQGIGIVKTQRKVLWKNLTESPCHRCQKIGFSTRCIA